MEQDRSQKQLSDFVAASRKSGLKLTHQRLEIFRELASSKDHPSAETLHKRLSEKMPMLSIDTVYRTLSTFSLHDLIHKVETVESHARFEVIHERHHHMICRQCREIIDFNWPSINNIVMPEEILSLGKIDTINVVVHGVCSKCSEKYEI